VKKRFSPEVEEFLAKSLHYDPKQRMKVDELFSNKLVSPEVAERFMKEPKREKKIYSRGSSFISQATVKDRKSSSIILKNFS